MLDRSGSMEGEPLAAAKAALLSGLRLLTRHDQFSVVAFDHEQLWWTGAGRCGRGGGGGGRERLLVDGWAPGRAQGRGGLIQGGLRCCQAQASGAA